MGTVDNHNPCGTVISAGELHSGYIGRFIRFMVINDETEITTVVEAELRQIYHVSGRTAVHVGAQAAEEQVLDPDTLVTIDPRPPLTYVHGEMPAVRSK